MGLSMTEADRLARDRNRWTFAVQKLVSLKHAVTRRDAVTVNNPAGDALRD